MKLYIGGAYQGQDDLARKENPGQEIFTAFHETIRHAVLAEKQAYPEADRVFVSPMKRCLETAAILYPNIKAEIVPDFRECDFGEFEYKNYEELNGRADYQAWIDSGGELPFPDGESRAEFAARSLAAFQSVRQDAGDEDCALIVHGGTIMSIMEAMANPRGNYYDFQVKNGCGYILKEDGSYTGIGL